MRVKYILTCVIFNGKQHREIGLRKTTRNSVESTVSDFGSTHLLLSLSWWTTHKWLRFLCSHRSWKNSFLKHKSNWVPDLSKARSFYNWDWQDYRNNRVKVTCWPWVKRGRNRSRFFFCCFCLTENTTKRWWHFLCQNHWKRSLDKGKSDFSRTLASPFSMSVRRTNNLVNALC